MFTNWVYRFVVDTECLLDSVVMMMVVAMMVSVTKMGDDMNARYC